MSTGFHQQPNAVPQAGAPHPIQVVQALIRTNHLLHREATCGDRSISPPRARVLVMAAERGAIRMGDLAACIGVTPRTITTLVDALERDGLIRRRPDPADRRATLLEVTDAGRAEVAEVKAFFERSSARALERLAPEERSHLYDLLSRVMEALSAHRLAVDDAG